MATGSRCSSGLSPGDRVVVDGADKLRDGAKISVRSESGTSIRLRVAATPGAPAAGTPRPAHRPPAAGDATARRAANDALAPQRS